MGVKTNRRRFLQTAAVTGVGYWVAGGVRAAETTSPNDRIAIANVGVNGKGQSDRTDASRNGDIVALCDVDQDALDAALKDHPDAKTFTDFRKMFDEMGDSIDAVTVSTPDHMHAPIALMAMRMGKHCFCQKPLARTIYEARLMADVAREMKVATQMGNQGTAERRLRTTAAQIKAGALGAVKEVHVWTNRPIWPQGSPRSTDSADPPATLAWDLWLGVAPEMPYVEGAYHPFNWRSWWDYGSGALGDMACHTVNMPFMALDLRDPTSVQATSSGHDRDSFPKWSVITYEYPAYGDRPPVKMVWYDGGKRVPAELIGGRAPAVSGAVFVGEKATLYAPGDYGGDRSSIVVGDVTPPEVEVPVSPGHFVEWIRAIRGGEPAMSNFPDYAGRLTETILLGNLAVWAAAGEGFDKECEGEKVLWDAENLKSTNVEGLETIIKPVYRDGYTLDV